MRELHKGSKRNIGVDVLRKMAEAFSIDTASYEVKDKHGSIVQSGDASFATDTRLFFEADTTLEGYLINEIYYPYWRITFQGMSKVLYEMEAPFKIIK